MKRSYALLLAVVVMVTALVVPATAWAFQITGGGGTQTQNPYGLWYAGQEACAREGCHSSIAAKPTVHAQMVTDVSMYPQALVPSASSGHWPYTSLFPGTITIRPRDIYLQVGDPSSGFYEYVGFEESPLATGMNPTDDLPIWDPMLYLIDEAEWRAPTSKVGNRTYVQSCAPCHNLGVTRASDTTYTLAGGGTQSRQTPSTVSGLSIQCEVCHGSGKNPSGHKAGVPGVVGGTQILKSQVCGQCHASGIANEKNVSANPANFGNPNGFTTDATLTAFFTAYTTVESETTFMAYVNDPAWPAAAKGTIKPRFLPNGADFSLRHSYFNEWLINLAPSEYGGMKGHADPVNTAVSDAGATGDTKCLRCHSGLGFLNRIDAKGPDGTRIVATAPKISQLATADPGISCQVCHSGHVGYKQPEGFDSLRKWANGREVNCGDCHNWQFEQLNQAVQYETINGVEHVRPAANTRVRHAQREMVSGGEGGDQGTGGMWGVEPSGEFMARVECKDCHMPRTHKEDMPAVDDGSKAETRMSHRFHVVLPGDAARWKLRPGGDSCAVPGCHTQEAAQYTRADFQSWIDQKRSAVTTASNEATGALQAAALDYGLSGWTDFIATKPGTGPAAALSDAKWRMLQHAAQNADFVIGDRSGGLHNPDYAMAGLGKALLWAKSVDVSVVGTLATGLATGTGMTMNGSLTSAHGAIISGAEVVLESSKDGGSTWLPAGSATTGGSGTFSIPTGRIVGSQLFRCTFSPDAGVSYSSAPQAVQVPVTLGSLAPAFAMDGWVGLDSVTVALTATPGSLTVYTLAGATTRSQTVYTGSFPVTAEGLTTVTFWSADSNGVEAPVSMPVRIDRAAPTLACDAVALYTNSAIVRASASDSGAGIATLESSLDGAPFVAAPGSWVAPTVTGLGSHTLRVRATDGAGKVADQTWSFAVKAPVSVAKSPTKRSYNVGYKRTWTTKATISRAGSPVAGKTVLLQRSSNNRSWKTSATLRTDGAGRVSRSLRFSSRGTTYWRWFVPEDGSYFSAGAGSTKIVVK